MCQQVWSGSRPPSQSLLAPLPGTPLTTPPMGLSRASSAASLTPTSFRGAGAPSGVTPWSSVASGTGGGPTLAGGIAASGTRSTGVLQPLRNNMAPTLAGAKPGLAPAPSRSPPQPSLHFPPRALTAMDSPGGFGGFGAVGASGRSLAGLTAVGSGLTGAIRPPTSGAGSFRR